MEQYFKQRILPAITLDDPEDAVSLAKAFIDGGLNVMEITFRTNAAIESIRAIRRRFPEFIVGAGTILNSRQIEQAKEAGAHFGLAPGLNMNVIEAAHANKLPFIPGAMSPSEVEKALEQNCNIIKLFPVKMMGGTEMIKALNGPYAHTGAKFIPMGGVNLVNLVDYLAFPNVIAAGGSWLSKKSLIREKQFSEITSLVKKTLKKSGSLSMNK